MFSRVRSFLYRHRRKFVVTGIVVGGAVLISRYVQRALREWHESQTKEFLERTRKQQHYESIERTCNQTALTLVPKLKETLNELENTEALIQELKTGERNKIAIWEELKIMAFTKIVLLIYLGSLLIITLRIKLNLVGGYMFRDLADEGNEKKVTNDLQEAYLSLCQYLLGNGARQLRDIISEKVKLILGNKSLKEKLCLSDVEQVFWAIQSAVSNDEKFPLQHLPTYIFPPDAETNYPRSPVFSQILLETGDLLESDEVHSLTNSCLSRGFGFLIDNISEFFVSASPIESNGDARPSTSSSPDSFFTANMTNAPIRDVTKTKIPLAKLIPIINGLVLSNFAKDDLPEKWVRQLILMDNLKVLGANVYETFSV